MVDDNIVNNKYYSHVGGLPIKELNSLECKLLGLMNFDLFVSSHSFELYRYELELQLIRQMCADTEDIEFTVDDMLKWEDPQQIEHGAPTAEGLAFLRTKGLRRSRSFNSSSTSFDPKRTPKRKNRSISFTILGLVSASAT